MGLWNYIRLLARDGPILVFTACCYTGTVHTLPGCVELIGSTDITMPRTKM